MWNKNKKKHGDTDNGINLIPLSHVRQLHHDKRNKACQKESHRGKNKLSLCQLRRQPVYHGVSDQHKKYNVIRKQPRCMLICQMEYTHVKRGDQNLNAIV